MQRNASLPHGPSPRRPAGADLGSAFLWIKLADRGFSPVEVTLARLALGAAVLFAIVLVCRESVPRSLRLWGHIAGAVRQSVPYLLFAVAEQTVNSSTAGIINATTPLWTVVLARARLCGCALGLNSFSPRSGWPEPPFALLLRRPGGPAPRTGRRGWTVIGRGRGGSGRGWRRPVRGRR